MAGMVDVLSNLSVATGAAAVPKPFGESEFVVPQIRVHSGVQEAALHAPTMKRLRDANRRRKKTKKHKSDLHDDVTGVAAAAAEGHRIVKEPSGTPATISSAPMVAACSCEQGSLAEVANSTNAMELADSVTYSSDEWEQESCDSDSDDEEDDSDSSDDDDPKSQVDRLIEKGTLMYMDGENSALSSEDDSDSSDCDSDITDVSPIMSARQSPLGLSPVLPRRAIPTSPLAVHHHRDPMRLGYFHSPVGHHHEPLDLAEYHGASPFIAYSSDDRDTTNMELLMQAVVELENSSLHPPFRSGARGLPRPHSKSFSEPGSSSRVFIHPIRDNPHHRHLRKLTRKNMSFSNEEVRKIDRDNKILLKKIMAVHSRAKLPLQPSVHVKSAHKPVHTSSSSAINRKKEEERIRRDNMIILRKIQEVKPSKGMSKGRILSSSSVS